MGELTLILGGVRSGKTAYAEEMARQLAGDDVLYVATAAAHDEEMQARIARHRAQRPPAWQTLEATHQVGATILARPAPRVILLDCLTVLVSNVLLPFEDPFAQAASAAVTEEVEGLLRCADQVDAHFLVVSNEVGMGVVPPYPLGRAYRDLLGWANQAVARQAETVLLLVAGIPLTVKGAR